MNFIAFGPGILTTEQKKDLLLAEQVHVDLVCLFWEALCML